MTTPDALWAAIFAAGVTYEAYALADRRDGDTLSETTRRLFRVRNSKAGRWIFGILWSAFALWYWAHILYDVPFPGF